MVIKAHDEMESEDEDNVKVKVSPLATASDECIEYSVKGNVLVVKRALNIHVKVRGL
jgi:hypothetical protein